jgi:hypothetical protein
MIVLLYGNLFNMLQTGGITAMGEVFRSTKHWELNRKKKVLELATRKKEKKEKKIKKETLVPEGAEAKSELVP